MHLVTLATCSLNQWALDWTGNADRVIESLRIAKREGAKLRVGPELEITGYGCFDHFLEGDTFLHAWEMLARIIQEPDCQDILVDVGMPVRHRNVRYNCRVIFYNKKILLIRPKMHLAQDGNYREMRYFTPWVRERETEDYYLESIVGDITGQYKVPFGDGVISTRDSCIGAETCEELFTPQAPHIPMGLNGVEIFSNSSGSHHELRKLQTRTSLIIEATRQAGGIYLYANQQGCDGDRLYYDGCAMIIVNGQLIAQGTQFSLNDVEVVTATVDLEDVRSYRCTPSRGLQGARQDPYPRFEVDMRLSAPSPEIDADVHPSPQIPIFHHSPAQEIALGPAAWLWDYLRRSGAAGFFIPLSGGIDSCATSVIVYSMCRLVVATLQSSITPASTKLQVAKDCRKACQKPEHSEWLPSSPQDLCGELFHTCFMGSVNSSTQTRARAKDLAGDIGAYHTDLNIDSVTTALTNLFSAVTNFTPRFKTYGGSPTENLALQNIQARIRMVIAYLFAQLLPTVRGKKGGLLVLGSANVDESLRGYLTKYDCSSADLNPIGSISKTDLKMFIASQASELPILHSFLDAVPTAELEPIKFDYVQSDEVDMGMTYEELSVFGRLRKVSKLGPWAMYEKLLHLWSAPPPLENSVVSARDEADHQNPDTVHAQIHGRGLSPRSIAEKVARFYHYHFINRHKMTVLTPSYHAEAYSPDDNRFDLRPFLYPSLYSSWAYSKIVGHVEAMERKSGVGSDGKKVVKGD